MERKTVIPDWKAIKSIEFKSNELGGKKGNLYLK